MQNLSVFLLLLVVARAGTQCKTPILCYGRAVMETI